MGPSTLLLDALSPAGRRAASSLAARGKDLVLCGEMPSLLEELAAELRVIHGVDVRTCVADLGSADAVEEVAAWFEQHAASVDGLLLPRWEDADPTRAAQLARNAEALRSALGPAFRRAGVEAHVRTLSSIPSGRSPSRVPPRQRKRASVMAPSSPPGRSRVSTRRGHADPSSSAPPR